MQDRTRESYDDLTGATGTNVDSPRVVEDHVIGTARPIGAASYVGPAPYVDDDVDEVRDRVRWGPILGGLATSIATLVALTVLGLALGASVLDRNTPGEEIGTWAAIWGGASAVLAFLAGGFIAAKSAAVSGQGTGMLNGFLVGAAALVVILLLTGSGLGNLFGLLGADLGDIADAIQNPTGATGQEVQSDLRASFDEVEDGAWGTLIGLVLPLAAATIGGWLGHNSRRQLVRGGI